MKIEGRTMMGAAGGALLAGFFLPWIDLGMGGAAQASGLDMVTNGYGWSSARLVVLLVPIAGALLLAAAVKGVPALRKISLVTGLGFLAYGVVQTVRTFFAVTGFGLWLVIAAALVALATPLLTRPEKA